MHRGLELTLVKSHRKCGTEKVFDRFFTKHKKMQTTRYGIFFRAAPSICSLTCWLGLMAELN